MSHQKSEMESLARLNSWKVLARARQAIEAEIAVEKNKSGLPPIGLKSEFEGVKEHPFQATP